MRNMRDFNWIRPKGSHLARNASFSFFPCLAERKVGVTRVNNGARPFLYIPPPGNYKAVRLKRTTLKKSFVA
jgi:hypothetical protein